MKKIAFIFPSIASEKSANYFKAVIKSISFDIFYLCSKAKEKIAKKDVDLDLTILDQYDIICPVGAESLKYACKETGVTKYNGTLIKDRIFPILDPSYITFKPQYKEDINKAINNLTNIIESNIIKAKKDHRYIDTEESFIEYIETRLKSAKFIVLDIETTSFNPMTGVIIGVCFSTKVHEGVFVSADVVRKFKTILQEIFNNAIIIFHNSKFDMKYLEYEMGFTFPKYEDTMLLHYVLDESVGTHGLKDLALKYTDLGDYERPLEEYKKEYCRKNKVYVDDFNYGMFPIEILASYAASDGDSTMQLFEKFFPLIEANPKFQNVYYNILIPSTNSLMVLERNGGPIDGERLSELMSDYEIDIEECVNEILFHPAVKRLERINGKSFNPNSTQQCQQLFFTILQLPPIKETASSTSDNIRYSVDLEVLGQLDHPLAQAILDMRQKTKLLGTYLTNIYDMLDKDGRMRSSFNIHGTTSGRLSSSGGFNYQNIPRDNKDIKKIFKAKPGYSIVQGDLGTAEVYYAAALADDPFLQQAFIDKLDFHSYIAKQIFNLPCKVEEVKKLYKDHRQWAKSITFGILYQAGPTTISETANVSFEEAKEFIKKYFREARKLEQFINESNDFIKYNAYIYSFFGRKRRLPESKSTNRGVASHAIRSGVNFLIQSVASDINLMGFNDSVNWIIKNNLSADIIPFTVVHDSIVSEVKNELIPLWIEKSKSFIQADRGLSIKDCPINVDYEVGPSWGELSEYVK